MTQADMITFSRLIIPEISSTDVISDANLLIILNRGCNEFIKETDGIPTSALFDLVTNLEEYSLTTYVSDYSKMRKEGIWIYNSQNSKWQELDAWTLVDIANKFPTWLSMSAGLPLRYTQEGNIITLNPKASSTYAGTDYLKIFYYARSVDMSNNSHYPFSGTTTQYTHLAEYEEVPIEYVRYRVKQMLGMNAAAEEAKQVFYLKCADIKRDLKYRADLIRKTTAQGTARGRFYQEAFKR